MSMEEWRRLVAEKWTAELNKNALPPNMFAREDVAALRFVAAYPTSDSRAVELLGIADRIEALLPPES
jgi:hypothetical protein